MDIFDKLQRIPYENEYGDIDYAEIKRSNFRLFRQFLKEGCTVLQAVNGTYYYRFEGEMNQNGMRKLLNMVHGLLFMIEHGDVEKDQAYGTLYDIRDFETGEYDDLFTPEDLRLLKADIAAVKEYMHKHPELLDEPWAADVREWFFGKK